MAALLAATSQQQMTLAAAARMIDIQPSYLSMLRRRPELLARCSPPVLQRISSFINWRLIEVYVDVGLIPLDELPPANGVGAALVEQSIQDLKRTGLMAGIGGDPSDLAPEHQRLIAVMFRSMQSALLRAG